MFREKLEQPRRIPSTDAADIIRERYTRELQDAGVEGTVLVSLDIDEFGRVAHAQAIDPPRVLPFLEARVLIRTLDTGEVIAALPRSSHPALRAIAAEAASAERFEPATRDGRPVSFKDYRMSFTFPRRVMERSD